MPSLDVYLFHDRVGVLLSGAPSTHILKPAIREYEGIVTNEAFCMRLAKALKLKVAEVEIGSVDGIEYLLIERYDRRIVDGKTIRLHQEDFCQALGRVSENKYQREGGPSLKDCFDLVRSATTHPVRELLHLLDAVLFNFLIGNNEAHGKNFSLVYNGSVSVAPLYDLICTEAYPALSKKMAMKIGSKYESEDVLPRHFEAMAQEAGLSASMVRNRLATLAKLILDELDGLKKGRIVLERNCANPMRTNVTSFDSETGILAQDLSNDSSE